MRNASDTGQNSRQTQKDTKNIKTDARHESNATRMQTFASLVNKSSLLLLKRNNNRVVDMKYTYQTELEWMEFRDRTRRQKFFTRGGYQFILQCQDNDERLQGYDIYTVENPEDKTVYIAMAKWNREELAGQVQEQIITKPIDDALELFQLFNEQHMTYNVQIDEETPELET